MIGIKLSPLNNEYNKQPLGPSKAIYYSLKEVWFVTITSLNYLGAMIVGSADTSQLGGPIKIAKITGQVAEHPGAIAESARPRPEVRPVLHAPLRPFASADGIFALRQIYAASEDLPADPGQGRAGDRLPEQRHAGQVTASNL